MSESQCLVRCDYQAGRHSLEEPDGGHGKGRCPAVEPLHEKVLGYQAGQTAHEREDDPTTSVSGDEAPTEAGRQQHPGCLRREDGCSCQRSHPAPGKEVERRHSGHSGTDTELAERHNSAQGIASGFHQRGTDQWSSAAPVVENFPTGEGEERTPPPIASDVTAIVPAP